MGTIAQKLEYLNDTRLLLKDNINKINNVLDDNSTFRSYPQELFNGYLDILNNGTDTLWSNLEKVSASGEEATLENVETAPIKMVLNGNTSQETTTGKNLYKFEKSSSYLNGITAELMEDGGIHCYGTATENYSNISADFENVLVAGNYTISYIGEFPKVALRAFYTDGGYVDYSLTSSNNKLTINFEKEISKYRIALVTTKGQTYDGILYFQLEQGSTATSWEKYTGGQPSPSPDYPQEVKVVKGENVVSVSGKNLQEMLFTDGSSNGIEWHIESDGSIIINGTTTSSVAIRYTRSNLMPVVEGKTYTLSATGMENIGNFGYKNSGTGKDIAVVTTSSPSLTFEATSNMIAQANRLDLYIRADKTFVNQKVTLQLEENSQATPYVPYSKTDYEVNLGKNLADISLGFRNGYLNTDTGAFVSENQSYVLNQYIEVKGATAYTYSLNNTITNMSIWSFDENKDFIKREKIVYSKSVSTITTDSNAKYVVLGGNYNNSTTITQEILESLDIQLELGSTATSYSSYFTPIELCKINTYKDYFHKDSGKWYVHKEIGKVVLDGSEIWESVVAYQREYFVVYISDILKTTQINETPLLYATSFNSYTQEDLVVKNLSSYGICKRTNQKQILVRNVDISTITNFKTWLSNNNVTLYYVLATATEEEITNTTLIEQLEAISKAKSVKDKTYITQTNDDLPFILDVEAIKEYEVN